MSIEVYCTSWEGHHHEISHIRRNVFIEEQGVSEHDEWDGVDALPSTIHVLAYKTEGDLRTPIGTARYLESGQIGRMCVLKAYRNQGIGGQLLSALLDHCEQYRETSVPIFLNAQLTAIGFYKKFGFITQGDVFDDAGIDHKKMVLNP